MNNLTKRWCDVCHFNVNPIGHAERCMAAWETTYVSESMLRLAWVGDTLHRLDIQVVAILSGVPHNSSEPFVQQYATNDAMRQYMQLVDSSCQGSARRLGTLFESNYFGGFRERYLRRIFPAYAERVLMVRPNINGEYLFGRDWWQ